jgi:2'-5' RNA ligase
MRLFTGIEPSAAVIETLTPVVHEAHGEPPANLHITTKFIGHWPTERLAELKDAIGTISLPEAFAIHINGLSMFGRVLVADIETGPELPALAQNLDHALEPLGIAPETRRFVPHLTLARPRHEPHENIGTLRHMIRKMGNIDFGSFEATEFHLYLSQPTPKGSVYTKLATWQFARRPE